MDNGNSMAFGSIYQAGCWDHDTNASTASVPSVFKTTNDGATWQRTALSTAEGEIKSLAVQPSNKNIIYAGGFTKDASYQDVFALFKTTNGGTNWNSLTVPGTATYNQINAILIDPSNVNRIYLGTSQGVYISTNGGTNWQSPPIWMNVACLAADGKTANKVYAGTSSMGVYVTTNSGTTWTAMNNGLTTMYIQCMDMDPVNNMLYIGTQGGGVYRLSLTTGIEDGHPNRGNQVQFVLHQNYPNPFNASTEIRYDLSKAEKVRLSLFDVQGKIIRVLLDRIENEGDHKVRWDGKDSAGRPVPSGIYFYRLQTESGSVIRKLALQK